MLNTNSPSPTSPKVSSMGIYCYRIFQDSSDFENVSWLSPKGHSDHMTWLVFGKRGRCRAGGTHSHPRPLHGSPEHSRHRRQTAGLTDRTGERDLLVPSVGHIPRPGPRRRTGKRYQCSVCGWRRDVLTRRRLLGSQGGLRAASRIRTPYRAYGGERPRRTHAREQGASAHEGGPGSRRPPAAADHPVLPPGHVLLRSRCLLQSGQH